MTSKSEPVSILKLSARAEKLLRLLYKRYLDRRNDGVIKSEAFAIGDAGYICDKICTFYNVHMSSGDIEGASDELYKYDLIFKNHFGYIALKDDFLNFCTNNHIKA